MSEQINIDGVKFKIGYDSAAVEKGLKDDEKKASEAGKKVGSNFSNAFQAVVGAGAMVGLKAFFSRAESEFNRLEGAMKRVESIAKGFGRNIELAKKNVNELADEGFLNLTQAASGYADAIALGFDEKQARKFIGALSDIAAYQNTIGNGAEAVTSGLAGLLSNSAEKVENIGVPVKILNQEYNKNIATMGKAAALQKFYNGILKESEKFQGDAARSTQTLAGAQASYNAAVEKSFQTIGKGLEPVLKRVYAIAADLANKFTEWFSGLGETTQQILILTPIIAGLAASIAAIIPLVGSLMAGFAWIPAVIVGVGALAAALANVGKAKGAETIAGEYQKIRDAVLKTGQELDRLSAIQNKTAEQELKSIQLKRELTEKAKLLGTTYEALAKDAGSYYEIAQKIAKLERAKARREVGALGEGLIGGLSDLKRQRDEATALMAQARVRGDREAYSDLQLRRAELNVQIKNQEAEIAKTKKRFDDLDKDIATESGKGVPSTGGAGGKRGPESRFIEARDQLKKLKDEYTAYLRIERDGAKREEASTKYFSARRAIEADLRGAIAEYNEETVTAQQEAAKREYEDQVKRIYELANVDEKAKKRVAEDLQKAQESYARQNAKIYAESFARTMQGANAIASGFAGALRAQNIGQALGGFGGIAQGIGGLSERFEAFGVIGQGIAAAGGIISTLTDLFGKSDAERAREAEEQKRRDEETKAILELQANYQKNMLALQEAQARLPFENMSRQLRLIDINAQQQRLSGVNESSVESQRLAARQAAIQGTLSSQGGTIAGGSLFSNVSADPQSLTAFINERAAQSAAINQFMQLAEIIPTLTGSAKETAFRQLQSYKGLVPDELYNAFQKAYDVSGGILTLRAGQEFASGLTTARGLFGEITRDTATAESLLSVIQDSLANQIAIEENTRKTAENTSKALTLRPDRERSFIDVGRGYIQSLGQRLTNPALAAVAGMDRNIVLPGSIGMASGVATAARTLQERLTDAAEMNVRQNSEMIDILYDARAVLINMLAALDSDTSTINRLSVAEFDRIQSEVNRRRR